MGMFLPKNPNYWGLHTSENRRTFAAIFRGFFYEANIFSFLFTYYYSKY